MLDSYLLWSESQKKSGGGMKLVGVNKNTKVMAKEWLCRKCGSVCKSFIARPMPQYSCGCSGRVWVPIKDLQLNSKQIAFERGTIIINREQSF